MSFVFPVRPTTARPTNPRNMSSIRSRSPGLASLPIISEDEDGFVDSAPPPPPIPQRAPNRPVRKSQLFGAPPKYSFDKSAPPYISFTEHGIIGPKGERLSDLRRGLRGDVQTSSFIARRGGWKRLAIIGAVLMCLIVGLVVGLVLGLRKKSHGSADDTTPDPAIFPAGFYRFETVLSSISTNCTSNPATWLCYPYTTYAQSPTTSEATFDWVISPSVSSKSYTISSSVNYFSILFSNVTLSLRKANAADEHYFFNITMQKPTKPRTQLGSQNVASTCYFNQTMLQGYLYTKINATYGGSNGTNPGGFKHWPYAAKIQQISAGGTGSPTCLGPEGQVLGDFSVADTSQTCACSYMNTGT